MATTEVKDLIGSGDVKTGESPPAELFQLNQVNTNIDVIHLSTKSPYLEVNFIGTYLACILSTVCLYAGYVSSTFPSTVLAPSPVSCRL